MLALVLQKQVAKNNCAVFLNLSGLFSGAKMNVILLVGVVLDVLCVLGELLIGGTKCMYKGVDSPSDWKSGYCFQHTPVNKSTIVSCNYNVDDTPFYLKAREGEKKYGYSTVQYTYYTYIGYVRFFFLQRYNILRTSSLSYNYRYFKDA